MPHSRRRSPAPASQAAQTSDPPPPGCLLLIVTGSTIAAEMRDRPLAYRLRERVLARVDAMRQADPDRNAAVAGAGNGDGGGGGGSTDVQPVVCSDLWFLNAKDLADRPMIAVGEPNSNAATALVSSRLPTAFIIEGSLRVHLDPEFIDLRAAIWGVSAAATAAAIDLFAERYLDEFLNAAGL